jgi:hypothetical protein
MSDLGMTSIALDLAIGDVLAMHEIRCIFRGEKLGFVMAFQTLILRNVAIPLIDADVAFKTTYPALDISLVVKAYPLEQEFALWLDMTRTAFRTGETSLFPQCPRLVEVTDEAIRFGNGQMGALNDLGVAGGASQFLPPSQLLQVSSMVKGHVLKNHFLL